MSVVPLCIDATHPSLPGHFPGRPVVPGVVILDEVAAHAAALVPGRLARLPQIKFVAPLLPGQDARIELEAQPPRVRFRVLHGDRLLASGELQFQP